jgi:hypothetical protein
MIGSSMEDAIAYIENNGYEAKVKERTIGLWREIQARFKIDRKVKARV